MQKILTVVTTVVILALLFLGPTETAMAQEVPKIDFWPKTATSGTSIGVQGSGFTPNTFVRIFLGETLATIAPSDMSGNFSVSFIARDEGKILARDNAGREATASQEFKLIPQAWLEPWQTLVNKTLKIKGTGFPKNKEVLIYFEGRKISSLFIASHDFETDFWVPTITGGYKFIEIKSGDLTTLAKANFYVEAQAIYISPPQGRIGTLVAMTGLGFPPNSSVVICFADRTIGQTSADSNGRFKIQFSVPALEPGGYGVEVASGAIRLLSTFEILPPSLQLPSNQIKPGEKLILQVEGAIPFSYARIFLNEFEITPLSGMLVKPDGTLKIELLMPSLAPGDYSLKIFKGTKSEVGQTITLLPEPPGKVETALAPISQYLIRVWGYDDGKWKLYDPTVPVLSDLKEFERGKAYFIMVKENCELVSPAWIYKLYKGVNLIGWID